MQASKQHFIFGPELSKCFASILNLVQRENSREKDCNPCNLYSAAKHNMLLAE